MRTSLTSLIVATLLAVACGSGDGSAPVAADSSVPATTAAPSPTEEPLLVPNLVGLHPDVATRRLESAGFRVRQEERDVTSPDDADRVLSQSPQADLEATQGDLVILTVGRLRELTLEDQQLQAVLTIAVTRDKLIEVLPDLTGVESVDKVLLADEDDDGVSEVLLVDFTSAYRSDDNIRDAIWEVTRVVTGMIDLKATPDYFPAVRISGSGITYECSGEFMLALARTQKGRGDFDTECR